MEANWYNLLEQDPSVSFVLHVGKPINVTIEISEKWPSFRLFFHPLASCFQSLNIVICKVIKLNMSIKCWSSGWNSDFTKFDTSLSFSLPWSPVVYFCTVFLEISPPLWPNSTLTLQISLIWNQKALTTESCTLDESGCWGWMTKWQMKFTFLVCGWQDGQWLKRPKNGCYFYECTKHMWFYQLFGKKRL